MIFLFCSTTARAFVTGGYLLIPCFLCHNCLVVPRGIMVHNISLCIMVHGVVYCIMMYGTRLYLNIVPSTATTRVNCLMIANSIKTSTSWKLIYAHVAYR